MVLIIVFGAVSSHALTWLVKRRKTGLGRRRRTATVTPLRFSTEWKE
jgi:hypothetical protein